MPHRLTWRPRLMIRTHARTLGGFPVLAFGLRVGFWPCLRGPFVSVALGHFTLDLWVGFPSHRR